ncbi:MAG: hydroxymethylbilane synthase [Gemmatimonadaceae bacterium]
MRIGTRSSELAMCQARLVQHALEAQGVTSTITTYETVGDKRPDVPLRDIGVKGLFTQELEDDLAADRIDCAVHSLKDLPTAQPRGLTVAAVLRREDPRDVLLVSPGMRAHTGAVTMAALPSGCRVGTSSLRRRAQLAALRPDLEIVDLRGNVPTRIRKIDAGAVDAGILAAAGLHRLGVHARVDLYLDAPTWLPAPGQGAIAIQTRAGDATTTGMLRGLNDGETMLAVQAERALLGALDGGCQVPIGALLTRDDGRHVLHALVASIDGIDVVRGSIAIDAATPESGARRLAADLRARGGDAILAALLRIGAVTAPQPE